MDNSKLDQIIDLLDNMVFSRENPDRELAEIIINHVKIPFFRIDRNEKLITDILGIETRKVCDNFYYVDKIINDQLDYLNPGDYIIAPKRIDEAFTKEARKVEEELYVLKITKDGCRIHKKRIKLNLRGKKRTNFCVDEWKYIKIEDFKNLKINDEYNMKNIVVDLRCNSGGFITEMKAAFEKIFDSTVNTFKIIEKGVIDFRATPAKTEKNIFIIVDKTTCSSAEIFTGLGKLFHNATLIGTNMYGKNILCKRKTIGDIVIHIPDKEYRINGKSILEVIPDYKIDNICEFSEEEILKLCQDISKKTDTNSNKKRDS